MRCNEVLGFRKRTAKECHQIKIIDGIEKYFNGKCKIQMILIGYF